MAARKKAGRNRRRALPTVKAGLVALENEYKKLAPLASSFLSELQRQVEKLFVASGVELGFPLQSRVKAWPSISEKIERLSFNAGSILEFQDLVGLRIILLFSRDIPNVSKLLHENLDCLRDYDTAERLSEDQFGYSSHHFVIKLPSGWLKLPTFQGMEAFQAEIQLRTLSQHIWAEASRVLQYKQEGSVPRTMRRAVFRASALLESVDLEFDRVLEARDNYRQGLDVSSAGEQAIDDVEVLGASLDHLLPAENKSLDFEDYSRLLKQLKDWKIVTIDNLTRLWTKHKDQVLTLDRDAAAERLKPEDEYLSTLEELERAHLGVYYTYTGLIRMAMREEFGQPFTDYQIKNLPETDTP